MEQVRLGDVCKIVSGSTPKTNIVEYWDGDINWITPAELSDETYVIEESQRKITLQGVQKTGLKSFPKGTVILSSRAPIGKVGIAGQEMYCNQGFKNLICSEKIDNQYLYWYLKGKSNYLKSLGRGATFKEISKSIVENIKIPLPNLKKQAYVASVLKQCWDLMLMQKKNIKSFDTLIKSRFVEMFGDPMINPLGWNQTTLKEVGIGGLTYGSGASACEYDGNTRYIRITDIDDNGKLNSEVVSPSVIDEKYILNDGDILFARSGATVGKTYRYRKNDGDCLYAGYLIRLIPDQSRVLSDYVFYFTKTSYYENYIASNQKVVAQPNINAQQYGDLRICVPPMDVQKQFITFVNQVDKLKFALQNACK